jgi:periplasmic protein TonB
MPARPLARNKTSSPLWSLVAVTLCHGAMAAAAGYLTWEYGRGGADEGSPAQGLRLQRKAVEPVPIQLSLDPVPVESAPPAAAPMPMPIAIPTPPIVATTAPAPPVVQTKPERAKPAPKPRKTSVAVTAKSASGSKGKAGAKGRTNGIREKPPGGSRGLALISSPAPPYPAAARAAKAQGAAIIRATVDAAGHVRATRMHQSAGHPALDKAALQAVLRWRFRPPASGTTDTLVRVRFTLRS